MFNNIQGVLFKKQPSNSHVLRYKNEIRSRSTLVEKLRAIDLCDGDVEFSLRYGLNSQKLFRRASASKGQK
jgi:hypothetical protein